MTTSCTASSKLGALSALPRGGALRLAVRAVADGPDIVLGCLLLAVTLLLFLQTVCRYIFFAPIGWAEEGARLALIWLTFLGAAVCSRQGLHSRFTVLYDRSADRVRQAMGALTDMIALVFAGIMIVKGGAMVERTQYERWVMLDLPMSWSYLAIPVSGLLILGFTLRRAARGWRRRGDAEAGVVAVAVMAVVALVSALIGTPIAFMLGASAMTGVLAEGRTDLILIPTKMVEGVDSFVLLAIPLFIFAGSLMDLGGISLRIMRFARALVGHFHGGLPMTAVVSEMLFSGISGSTMADASAIASMDIPAMTKAGYKSEYAVSVVAAASAMGVLIPPCIIMVVLGALMNVSVAALFVGGFLPALVLALALFALISYQARKYRFPREERRLSLRAIGQTGLRSSLAMGMFVLIFGGILGGAMTPTEAGAVAVVYAFIVTVVIYREISIRKLWTIVVDSATQSGMVLFVLSVANIFSFLLSTQRVPQSMLELISGLSTAPWVFLTSSMALFIVLASVIEPLPVMIVFVPIFLPVIDRLGISRLHYGVLMTAATGLGMFVPPVGIGLILVCAIAKVKMTDVLRYLLPFLGILSVGLMVLIMFPTVTTILPRLVLPNIKP